MGRRNSGGRTFFYCSMAVTAVYPQAVNMMLMAEHHRLFPELIHPVEIRGIIGFPIGQADERCRDYCTKD
jgi:hypothetical protein